VTLKLQMFTPLVIVVFHKSGYVGSNPAFLPRQKPLLKHGSSTPIQFHSTRPRQGRFEARKGGLLHSS